MRNRSKQCLAILIGVIGFVSSSWAAEWIVFNPLRWQIKLDFEAAKKSTSNNNTYEKRFDEELQLRLTGYSLDPKIANYSLALTPVWVQGNYEFPGREETLDSHQVNYDFKFNVFSGVPRLVSYNGQLMRSSGSSDYSFGGTTRFSNTHNHVQTNWRNRLFPTTFSFTQRTLEQRHQSGTTKATSLRKDQLQTFRLKGQSSKTKINLEYNDYDDKVSNRSFTEGKAHLNHVAKWGKGSYLNSTLSLVNKNAEKHYENLYIAESARLQHTNNLYSTYRVNHSKQTQEFQTRRDSVELGLTHRLYQNLTTNAALSGATSTFYLGKQSEQGARLNLNYNKKFTQKISLAAGLGGEYRIADRSATGGLLEVIDENQSVDSTRILILNDRFIELSTVVVTDAGGLITFTEGSDYSIFAAGNNLTELQILPGGLINVGDTVLVDYLYASMPSMKFSTNSYNFTTSLNYGRYTFFHRRYQTNQNLESGDVTGFLTNRRDSVWGLQYRYSHAKTYARMGAEWRTYHSADFSSNTTIFKQSVGHTMSPVASLTLSANEIFSEGEGREFDLYNMDLSFTLRPRPRLSLTPRMGAWSRDETGTSNQRFFAASLDVRWTVRKLILSASIKHNSWRGSISGNDEDRVMFTIIRNFR